MSDFDNFLDDFKNDFFNNVATIKGKDGGFNSSNGTYSNLYADKITNVSISLWFSGGSKSYKGEKLTANIDAIAVIKYDDLNGIELKDSDIMVLANGDEYSFINKENVQGFNEVVEISLKRAENG